MALLNAYVTYPKDCRKVLKLRDNFEIGLIADDQLDPYEKTLVRTGSAAGPSASIPACVTASSSRKHNTQTY